MQKNNTPWLWLVAATQLPYQKFGLKCFKANITYATTRKSLPSEKQNNKNI